jgi:hypothetical protein
MISRERVLLWVMLAVMQQIQDHILDYRPLRRSEREIKKV